MKIMLFHKLISLLTILAVTIAQDTGIGRRVPSFIGMRGKKSDIDVEKDIPMIDLDGNDKADDTTDEFRSQMTKRAHLGFQGTRGKKMSELPFKRYVGFTGTRGKKLDSLSYPKSYDLDDLWFLRNELAKRKFYGTRGKKLLYPFNMMGARGKKGPSSSSFFGTRGKKSEIPINDEENTENLAALMYTLAHDRDYLKNVDFETNDLGSQSPQYQQLSNSDGVNA